MKRAKVCSAVSILILLGAVGVLYWLRTRAQITTVHIQPSESVIVAPQEATPEPTELSRPALTPDPTDIPSPQPTAILPRGAGKPFGPFNWPASLADDWPFTVSRLGYYGEQSLPELDAASRNGVSVLVAMTGGRRRYTDTDGCFSLEMWKDEFNRRDLNILIPYIDSRTIVGLYAMDEPHDWSCGPTYTELNEICGYVHSKIPNLPCGFGGASPAWYEQGLNETDFSDLDYILVQYSLRFAPVQEWIDFQFEHVDWFHGDVWLSMNIYAYSPTPQEIRDTGIALCQSDAVGVTMWKWPLRFDEPGMRGALNDVAEVCAGQLPVTTRTSEPCQAYSECDGFAWRGILPDLP